MTLLEKVLNFFGYKLEFTDKDEYYKSLRLSDFNLTDLYGIDDENLKGFLFFPDENIPKEIINKFIEKYFWQDMINAFHKYIYITFINFCIILFSLFNFNMLTLVIILFSFIISLYLRYKYKKEVKSYYFNLSFCDLFK